MTELDYEQLRAWLALLQIAQILITGVLAYYAWRVSRDRARRTEIAEVREEINGVRDRVQDIEADMRHLPTHGDLRLLNERLEEVHRDLKEMSGGFSGLRRAVDLMNQHLLEQRRRDLE